MFRDVRQFIVKTCTMIVKIVSSVLRYVVHVDESRSRVYKQMVGRRLQPPQAPPANVPAKSRKANQPAPEKELLAALTTPVERSRDLVQVMLTLPKAHIRVLDTEASVFGMRRYQFLELLLIGELSQPMMLRPAFMAPYSFTRAELTETERFVIVVGAIRAGGAVGFAPRPRPDALQAGEVIDGVVLRPLEHHVLEADRCFKLRMPSRWRPGSSPGVEWTAHIVTRP